MPVTKKPTPIVDDEPAIIEADLPEVDAAPPPVRRLAQGTKRVERVTRETFIEDAKVPPVEEEIIYADDEAEEVADLSPLDLLLHSLSSEKSGKILVQRLPDPPEMRFQSPCRVQHTKGQIDVDEYHANSDDIELDIQNRWGGGKYKVDIRVAGVTKRSWTAIMADQSGFPGSNNFYPQAAPPMQSMPQLAQPVAAAAPPQVTSPMEMMRDMIGMFKLFQGAVPEPPPPPPPVNPVDAVNSQVSMLGTLMEVSDRFRPAAPAGSAVAEVIEKLGIGEIVKGVGAALPDLARMFANRAAAQNGHAVTGPNSNGAARVNAAPAPAVMTDPAGLPPGPSTSGPGGIPLIEVPIPPSLDHAKIFFMSQLVHDGQLGLQPGIVAQMVETYIQRFPEFREVAMQFFALGIPPTHPDIEPLIATGMTLNEAAARIIIGALSLPPPLGHGVDFMAFPPFLGYMMDVRESVADLLMGDGEAEAGSADGATGTPASSASSSNAEAHAE